MRCFERFKLLLVTETFIKVFSESVSQNIFSIYFIEVNLARGRVGLIWMALSFRFVFTVMAWN